MDASSTSKQGPCVLLRPNTLNWISNTEYGFVSNAIQAHAVESGIANKLCDLQPINKQQVRGYIRHPSDFWLLQQHHSGSGRCTYIGLELTCIQLPTLISQAFWRGIRKGRPKKNLEIVQKDNLAILGTDLFAVKLPWLSKRAEFAPQIVTALITCCLHLPIPLADARARTHAGTFQQHVGMAWFSPT